MLDSLMREVAAGTHMLTAHLPRGIYRVEARVPGAVDERLVTLPSSGWIHLKDLAPILDSPVPLHDVRTHRAIHEAAAVHESRKVHLDWGTNSSGQLFIFVRTDGSPRSLPPVLTVETLDREPIASVAEDGVGDLGMGFYALSVALPPGTYLLTHQVSDLGLRGQAVFVEEGWQTQLFVPWGAEGGASDFPGGEAELERSLFTMVPRAAGFSPKAAWQYTHVEAALDGLAEGRIILSRKDERALRNGKFDNPILALIGAYGLAFGFVNYYKCEIGDEDRAEWSSVIANRILQLIPHSPDAHLVRHLLCGPGSLPEFDQMGGVGTPAAPALTAFGEPPIFADGIEALIGRAVTDERIIPAGSWNARMASVRTSGSVYSRWDLDIDPRQQIRDVLAAAHAVGILDSAALSAHSGLPLSLVQEAGVT
ncbi:hypothetical protein [Streptomyces djakartensis]|uniref:hypothetical protein n=1 Tax=Streptomyces djakartensis TaxID=68193 RepID=UPI00167E5447|nr:hypothetical protein [Streptomyces djakartensis]